MSKHNISIDDAEQSDAREEADDQATQETNGGGGDDLETRVETLEAENLRLRDQAIRTLAEFDNFRRRTHQEREQYSLYANENLLRGILPIIDDFQRSVESGEQTRDFDNFFKGVAMINDKLVRVLEGLGVVRIKTIGEPFSVDFHEALMRQPSDLPEGTVVGEVEPGYKLGDRVLRHAKVIVSAGSN
jgi:molecular chaperone GrpE